MADATQNAATGQIAATAADVYETFFVPALFGQWVDPMVEAASIGRNDRALDVGCGTGVLAKRMAARVGPEGRVVGLDPNDGMLAVARRTDGVEWIGGAAEDLPFDDSTFDAVVSQFAVMFFQDRVAALHEIARVLAPGGRLAVASWAGLDTSPGYAAMERLLDRLFGSEASGALRAPFCLGDPDELADLLRHAVDDVVVQQRRGVARFDSIESWVHTEIRGWTLSGMSDDEYARLLAAAQTELVEFTSDDGSVVFDQPALIATGRLTGTN